MPASNAARCSASASSSVYSPHHPVVTVQLPKPTSLTSMPGASWRYRMTTSPRCLTGCRSYRHGGRVDLSAQCWGWQLMAKYHFVTDFSVTADRERVWDALSDPTGWPSWWRWLKHVEVHD